MTTVLIDPRGRVLGRYNVVDAAAAVLTATVVAGVVAGYTAVRETQPIVTGITPTTVAAGAATRLTFTGRNLHPFLSAVVVPHGTAPTVDPLRSQWMLGVGDLTVAELQLGPLEAGEYDVHVYDGRREIAIYSSAIAVEPRRGSR